METAFVLDIKLQLWPQTLLYKFFYAVAYWVNYNIYFCKAAFFILGLVFSHKVVENTMESSLMDYLTDLGKSVPEAAVIVNTQEGLSLICALIIAHFADTCIGRFDVVLYATSSYFFGLLILCLASWFAYRPNTLGPSIKAPIIVIMVLLAVGKASKNPPLKAFLSDQLVEHKTFVYKDDSQVAARVKVWWFLASVLGSFASVIISGSYPEQIGMHIGSSEQMIFIIPALAMGVSYFIFWSGIGFYYRENPTGSPLTIVYRVFKASVLKLHQRYPNDPNDYYDNHSDQLVLFPDIRILRWLDKAAILESSPLLEEQVQGGRLCSVRDVKRVKQLLTSIPLWTTLLGFGLVLATGSTFFVKQSDNLDEVVPINAFFLIQDLVSYAAPYLYNKSIAKWWHKPMQQAMLVRIGVGMAFSILCCLSAWQYELHRLNLIHIYGKDTALPMSILWLAPQYICLGVVEGLVNDVIMFNYQDTDEWMEHYESPFKDCGLGFGKVLSAVLVSMFRGCWFNDTISTSHLDRYFLLLACLSSLNLCFYGYVACKYTCSEAPPDPDKNCMNLGLGPVTGSKVPLFEQSLSFPASSAAASRVVPLGSQTLT
ncbi:unnamed protein product [Dovyalis caffra]|uniref:Uncharacterized protein n=1 Tax=Dovyalis caffra TaxID=77055 RepID=A0AAV1S0S7_9ROSI|nr:unnamed protein product [Dovyalis caffra]